MVRSSLIALLLAGIPTAAANAGPGGSAGAGKKGLAIGVQGLRFVPQANPAAGVLPFNFHGSPGFPVEGVWGGFGGANPFYRYDYNLVTGQRTVRRMNRVTPQSSPATVSNQFPAALTVALPTHGEVWVNGEKVSADAVSAANEWTFKSPFLKADEEYTFDVTARWESEGNMFEYKKTIAVQGGKPNRIQVLSGTPMASSAQK